MTLPVITEEPTAGFTEISVGNLRGKDNEKGIFAAINIGLAEHHFLAFFHIDGSSHADRLELLLTLAINTGLAGVPGVRATRATLETISRARIFPLHSRYSRHNRATIVAGGFRCINPVLP